MTARVVFTLLVWVGTSTLSIKLAGAQPPGRGPAPAQARTGAGTPGAQVPATLAQLMRGTLYPASNIIFAAQDQNPAEVPPAKDPSIATNLLASSYGKWDAVENSALALAEVANLLTLPGRKCSNGGAFQSGIRIGPSSFKGCAMREWRSTTPPNPRTKTKF